MHLPTMQDSLKSADIQFISLLTESRSGGQRIAGIKKLTQFGIQAFGLLSNDKVDQCLHGQFSFTGEITNEVFIVTGDILANNLNRTIKNRQNLIRNHR